jgi:5-methylcytosine-specific restriction endonuclease McrA
MNVLLLDSTYEPLKIVTWMRAMTLILTGKVEVLEQSDITIRSPNTTWIVPSVIRQLKKFKRNKRVHFSRINVYMRDDWTCQYCKLKKLARDLTFDHVVPRYHGGKTNWTNIVTACKPCNNKKDNRTPEQANMVLNKRPEEPKWLPSQVILKIKDIPPEWLPYIQSTIKTHWVVEIDPM